MSSSSVSAFGGFFLRAVIDDDVAHGAGAFDAGDIGLLVGIDVLDFDLRGEIPVAIEHVARAIVGVALVEVVDVDVVLQIAGDFLRLVGERELLVGGDVDGLVVAGRRASWRR